MSALNDTSSQPEPNTLVLEDQSLQYGFIQLPKQILYARNLSRDAKFLYAILLGYAWQEQRCFPGYRRLCHDMQASENMVRKYMRELEAVGLLRQKRRGLGKTNIYTLPDLRTAKIEVLEPQFPEDLEPAKTEGKPETLEKDTDLSKFREPPTAKDKRRSTGSDRIAGDQSRSEPISGAGESKHPPGGHLAAATARNGHNRHSEPVPAQTPAKTPSMPLHKVSDDPEQGSGGDLPRVPRQRPPGTRGERELVTAYYRDFMPFLGDEGTLWSSVSEAINIFKLSGIPAEAWPELLLEANDITKANTQHIRKLPKNPGLGKAAKNRTPYFFEVLKDLCGLREQSDTAVPITS